MTELGELALWCALPHASIPIRQGGGCAKNSRREAAAGEHRCQRRGLEEVQRIIGLIRERWSDRSITLRADSYFARESLMAWCEQSDIHYVLGLARDARLQRALES